MARYHGNVHRAAVDLKASTIVTCSRKPTPCAGRSASGTLLEACLCDYTGRLGWEKALRQS